MLFLTAAAIAMMGEAATFPDSRDLLRQELRKVTSGLAFQMPEVMLPEFADRNFNVLDYGGIGDGLTMNTGAIQKAIDACSAAGGGRVEIPQGLWLTGPLRLKSNVDFHLDAGALIEFSRNHSDYQIVNIPRRGWIVESPIMGVDLENIALTGPGLIDGSGITWRPVKHEKASPTLWKELTKSGGVVSEDGSMWWPSEAAEKGAEYVKNLKSAKNKKDLTAADFLPARDFMRPMLVLLVNCKKVLIDGPTFENSPSYALYPNWCENVVIRNARINNEYWAQNGDGIDISSSKNVVIFKSTVTAGDDGICMKSSPDKNASGPTLKNVVISECVVYHAHGGFVIGSNVDGGIENISVRNCDFVGTDIGLRFKSARGKGGAVRNIFVDSVYMKNIVNEAVLFDTYYEEKGDEESAPQAVTDKTPEFKDFHLNNIHCDGAKQAVRAFGLPEMPVDSITITNSTFSTEKGFESSNVSGFNLENVRIIPQKGPVYSLTESKGVVIENGYCPPATDVFLIVAGKNSAGIRLIGTPTDGAKTPVKYGSDAAADAVTIK